MGYEEFPMNGVEGIQQNAFTEQVRMNIAGGIGVSLKGLMRLGQAIMKGEGD